MAFVSKCDCLPGRTERYNHELDTEDTEDDTEDILFHSFSSCSPRYSKVYSKIEELHQDVSFRFKSVHV